jgi:hypothetical protein
LLEHLDDRPVGDALAVGKATPSEDGRVRDAGQELRRQTRLADPGGAQEREQLTGALRADTLPGAGEQPELALAADHRSLEAPPHRLGTGCYGDQAIRGNALALSLERKGLERLRVDRVADEPERLGSDQDLPRLRRLLEPGRDVDRVSGDKPLLRARNDLAGVEPNAQRQRRAVIALELFIELPKRHAHLCRRTHRPERIVLVQDRDAEHRHDGIADEFLHRALVPLDHLPHRVEIARHDPTQRLWIKPLPQRGRATHITKADRDPLPHLVQSRGLGVELGTAVPAEFESLGTLLTAYRADPHGVSLGRRKMSD